MAAKRKTKTIKKKRAPKLCVVCRENPQDAGYSGICEDCDWSYAEALNEKVGTIEWASARAREFSEKRILAAMGRKP